MRVYTKTNAIYVIDKLFKRLQLNGFFTVNKAIQSWHLAEELWTSDLCKVTNSCCIL